MILNWILPLISLCESSRILVVSPTPSYSHQVIFQPIWKELALRGHDLVVLTTDPINTNNTIPNLKEIDLSFAYGYRKKHLMKIVNESHNAFSKLLSILRLQYEMLEGILGFSEVQALIKNETEFFDLVMLEYHNLPTHAFKHRFNSSFIGLQSMDLVGVYHEYVGNPNHPIQYPEYMFGFEKDLGFFERVASVLVSKMFWVAWDCFYKPDEEEIVRRLFGEGYPRVEDLARSVDMVFINSNHVFHQIRPVTPATVNIGGGIHMKRKSHLPKGLNDFFNNSNKGVIYMSLGGNVKSKDLQNGTLDIFNRVFSELEYDILWKFEAKSLHGKPKNVKIIQWAPQQDILGHENLKLFITQGGMQSLEEALLSEVPVLVLPFYGDQIYNAKRVVEKNLGLSINQKTITQDELKGKILEVIQNPKYKKKSIELASLLRDKPMSALEKAVWWTEYVLRHGGAQHLKGKNIPTYQFFYLDVFGFLGALLAVICYGLYSLFASFVKKKKCKSE